MGTQGKNEQTQISISYKTELVYCNQCINLGSPQQRNRFYGFDSKSLKSTGNSHFEFMVFGSSFYSVSLKIISLTTKILSRFLLRQELYFTQYLFSTRGFPHLIVGLDYAVTHLIICKYSY